MNKAAEEYGGFVESIASHPTNQSELSADSSPHDNFYESARFATGLFIYPIIGVIGLTGNGIALVVLSRPTMVTSYNVILAALAVNDVIKLLNDLVYFVDVILQRVDPMIENTLFGHAYPFSHYIFNQTACITAWLTVLVTVERYICVCRATRYRSVCTVRRATIVIAAVFITMSLLAAPSAFRYRTYSRVVAVPIQVSSVSSSSNHSVFTDVIRYANRTIYEVRPTTLGSDRRFVVVYFDWTLSLIRSVVPLFLLSALTTRIVCAIWNRPSPVSSCAVVANVRGRHNNRSAKNCSVTFMLILVVAVFVICIVPDAIMSIVFGVGYVDEQNGLAKGIRELTDALLALSSAVNFVVYCLCSRRFRGVLGETLCSAQQNSAFDGIILVENNGVVVMEEEGADYGAGVDDGGPCTAHRRFSRRQP